MCLSLIKWLTDWLSSMASLVLLSQLLLKPNLGSPVFGFSLINKFFTVITEFFWQSFTRKCVLSPLLRLVIADTDYFQNIDIWVKMSVNIYSCIYSGFKNIPCWLFLTVRLLYMQGCLCWISKYSMCFKKWQKQCLCVYHRTNNIMNHFLSFPCKYHTLHDLHGRIVAMPVLVLLLQGMYSTVLLTASSHYSSQDFKTSYP